MSRTKAAVVFQHSLVEKLSDRQTYGKANRPIVGFRTVPSGGWMALDDDPDRKSTVQRVIT